VREVCADFGAELRECHGEAGHVHLLVTFPSGRSGGPPITIRCHYVEQQTAHPGRPTAMAIPWHRHGAVLAWGATPGTRRLAERCPC
jgi:hypothetical protein